MKKNKLRVLVVCGILMAYSLCACASNNASADSQKSTSSVSYDEVTTNENNTTDMKKKTDESLKMYVDLIGTETEDGNINVSDEFLDNVSNVYIMGRTGTVNHGMTETSDTQIRIMEWRDNNETTEKKFEEFISLLNDYWGEQGQIGSYDNRSDETYVWKDYDNSAYVACWYSENTIKMNWEFDESIESSKEASDMKRLMQSVDGKNNTVADDEIIEKVLEDRKKKEPQIGMTADEVRQSIWGEPDDINKSTYSWGVKEQWCYSDYRYIYFEDGIVTSIHE